MCLRATRDVPSGEAGSAFGRRGPFRKNHWDSFLIPKAINREYIAGPVRTIESP